jgi:hypothetical protein
MIKVQKNESFPAWIQVFAFGMLIDEYSNGRRALKEARTLAKRWDIPFFLYMDQFMET